VNSVSREFFPSDISFAPAGKKDVNSLVAFSKRMRRHNIKLLPFDKKELIEKYRAYGGSDDKLNLFILKYKNLVIGCAGYVQFKGLLNRKNISGIIANAVIVDPAYRNLFPIATVLLGRSYKDLIFKHKLFTLLVPLDDAMSLLYKKRPFKHFAYLYQFMNPFIAKIKPVEKTSQIEIKEIDYFDKNDTDAFFKRISSQHYFLMHMDSDFLNWRYSNNAYYKFTILTAAIKNKFIGYIVTVKIGTDIYIVDITVDLNYPSAILHLMFKSFSYFDSKTITNAICCATHQSYINILKKAGFFCSWKRECLFFTEGLNFFKINKGNFDSSNRKLYHFNGFARHLY
jgi:hypothetical protein